MLRVLFGLFLLLHIVAARAAWNVETKTDSMTDETKKLAIVTNEEGHSLSIYRGPNGAVWGIFSLSKQSLDQLSPRNAPVFRVDKNKLFDLAAIKRLHEMGIGANLYAWEPKWVNFSIWHGDESRGRSEDLDELMHGSNVVFRYFLFTGGYKETTFSLDGAGPAIASALEISVDADSDISRRAKELDGAVLAAIEACTKDISTSRACFDRVQACKKRSGGALVVFQECMQ